MTAHRIAFTLNGAERADEVPANLMLADYLKERCGLNSARVGCARGVCGACTILMDGQPRAACSVFAFQIDGREITTIEGIGGGGALDPVQQAFVTNAAFQCGYCTPGMILLTKALLARNASPSRAEIVEWLSSNVCRCTGYAQIIAAVEDAASRARASA